MDIEKIPAYTRGHENFGWLDTYHSFSFGRYYDPDRVHFGTLRVLNDDSVAPGRGFGRHPHDNMEIISIPLSGALKHADSMGHSQVIGSSEVQVMSAGTGIEHEEYNASDTDTASFLQIWIVPRERDRQPRYEQKSFNPSERENAFQLLVSPDGREGSLWIGQDAFISRATLSGEKALRYERHSEGTGLYVFLLEGKLQVGRQTLQTRDAAAVTHTDCLNLQAEKNSDVLVLEIPLA